MGSAGGFYYASENTDLNQTQKEPKVLMEDIQV